MAALAKRKKNTKARQSPVQAPPASPPPPPTRQRATGGVPPLDAFDSLPQRRPPGQGGGYVQPRQGEPDAAGQNAGGKTGKTRQKKGKARAKAQPAAQTMPEDVAARPRKPQKPVNQARRRRHRRATAVLLGLIAIGLGVWFSVSVLFKIEKFQLQGEVPYTVEELSAIFGHAPGDNMYGFVKASAEQRIMEQLPYLETLEIRRRLPGTIVFRASCAQEAYFIEESGRYTVLSTQLKALRTADAPPEGLTQLRGLTEISAPVGGKLAFLGTEGAAKAAAVASDGSSVMAQDTPAVEPGTVQDGTAAASGAGSDSQASQPAAEPQPEEDPAGEALPEGEAGGEEGDGGSTSGTSSAEPTAEPAAGPLPAAADPAQYHDGEKSYEALQELLPMLSESGLSDITWIDVTDELSLSFRWQDRITVKLGKRSEIEQNLRQAVTILTNSGVDGLGEADRGTLDMTSYSEIKKSYFLQE